MEDLEVDMRNAVPIGNEYLSLQENKYFHTAFFDNHTHLTINFQLLEECQGTFAIRGVQTADKVSKQHAHIGVIAEELKKSNLSPKSERPKNIRPALFLSSISLDPDNLEVHCFVLRSFVFLTNNARRCKRCRSPHKKGEN